MKCVECGAEQASRVCGPCFDHQTAMQKASDYLMAGLPEGFGDYDRALVCAMVLETPRAAPSGSSRPPD